MINEESTKRYCKDFTKIKNYEAAKNDEKELWIAHHIMEEVFTTKELMRAGWYYNRSPEELVFIRISEHNGNTKLHISYRRQNENKKGKKLSEEHKRKIAESHEGKKLSDETKAKLKGKTAWNKGKNVSEETRKKIAEYRKGRSHSEETKRKISESQKKRRAKEKNL